MLNKRYPSTRKPEGPLNSTAGASLRSRCSTACVNGPRERRVSHSTCTKTGCLKVKITSYAIHTKPNCQSLRSFFHFLRIYKKQVQQEARQITRLLASSAVTALSLLCTASLPSTRRAWAH